LISSDLVLAGSWPPFSQSSGGFPKWWGALDVSLAFVLTALALVILGLAQGKVSKQAEDMTYRAYRILIHGVFAMLVAFFLLGVESFGQLSNWLGVESLVTVVCSACVVYGTDDHR
jgi:hypothetical protein